MESTTRLGIRAATRGLALLVLLTGVACGRSTPEPVAVTDTAAVIGPYAPDPGAEAVAQPQSTRVQRFHLVTRRVRHRHAGPR
jgi:hypothetical protein